MQRERGISKARERLLCGRTRRERGVTVAWDRRVRGRFIAAWEAQGGASGASPRRGRGVGGASLRSERGLSTAWRASSRRGRGVTAAWNWRFVLVEALGFGWCRHCRQC